MLDVRRLQVLRSVVATGSVSGAAQALGYTASSVSQQISVLAREAGVELVEPAGRGIRPTAAARLLDEYAARIFEDLDRAEQALADHRTRRLSRLRVEYFTTAGRGLVAPAVAAFNAVRPGVQVELRLQPDGAAADRVSRGEVDVALAVADGPRRVDGVTWTSVMEDPFQAVLPAGHPLAGHGQVSLAALAELPWVTHEWPLAACSAPLLQACAVWGFTPRYRVECADADTAQGLIAAGAGIGVMPRLGLARPDPGVVVRALQDPAPRRRIYALHGRGPHAEAMVEALLAPPSGQATSGIAQNET